MPDDPVDAVDLCTPAFARAEQTLAAVQAGQHVMVQKPLAVTVDDTEWMAAAARDARVVSLVTENWVFFSRDVSEHGSSC